MKKFLVVVMLLMCLLFTGCTQQSMVRSFGGDMTVDLEPGMKLELVTWKDDDSLWYFTRPMRDDEVAEEHTYQQSSAWGIFEGTITIREHNK